MIVSYLHVRPNLIQVIESRMVAAKQQLMIGDPSWFQVDLFVYLIDWRCLGGAYGYVEQSGWYGRREMFHGRRLLLSWRSLFDQIDSAAQFRASLQVEQVSTRRGKSIPNQLIESVSIGIQGAFPSLLPLHVVWQRPELQNGFRSFFRRNPSKRRCMAGDFVAGPSVGPSANSSKQNPSIPSVPMQLPGNFRKLCS